MVGLYAVNLDSNVTVAHRDDDMFAMCSTFKAYLSARVLQKAQRGELTMTDMLYVDPAAVIANSPISEPKAGSSLSLNELCQAVLQRSDNTAANMLLRLIGGPPAITEFARSIGDDRTRLDRWEDRTELRTSRRSPRHQHAARTRRRYPRDPHRRGSGRGGTASSSKTGCAPT